MAKTSGHCPLAKNHCRVSSWTQVWLTFQPSVVMCSPSQSMMGMPFGSIHLMRMSHIHNSPSLLVSFMSPQSYRLSTSTAWRYPKALTYGINGLMHPLVVVYPLENKTCLLYHHTVKASPCPSPMANHWMDGRAIWAD